MTLDEWLTAAWKKLGGNPKQRPTLDDLARWFPECPKTALQEADQRLTDTMRGRGVVATAGPDGLPNLNNIRFLARWVNQWAWGIFGPNLRARGTGDMDVSLPAEFVHQTWFDIPQGDRPKHPVSPLVKAWQERPTPKQPRKLTNRASLPRLHKMGESDTRLPGFPQDRAPQPMGQAFLFPELAPPECPSWLLWLFDRTGGQALSQGRGAPWPMRLWIGAVLHLDIGSRDGLWHTLQFPTEEVIRWLHPNGWGNRRRDWERFPEALHSMAREMAYVPVPGLGSVALLYPSVIPREPHHPLVEFTIRIPPHAASGARIDWHRLCKYGTDSAGLYRAYLAAVSMMDRAAHKGHPITQTIQTALTLPNGRPKRRRGGALERSRTERKPNPAARYVKAMSEHDLAALIGFDPTVRMYRLRAREAFERLKADGVIDLQRDGKGWRIFGASSDGEAISGASE